MTKVFIGGSRRVSRLNADVKHRIDRIIEQGFPVLVGDASGADKAVQKYLHGCGYGEVEVFCSGGECRNNLGNWPIRAVATAQARRDFDYYAAKDEQMAREASVGLMIWDGKSVGTLANAARLVRQDKKVVIYATPTKRFLTLKAEADWERLVSSCGNAVREKVRRSTSGARQQLGEPQRSLNLNDDRSTSA
jgi:adenine-specific DNA-methyltransferase